MRRKRKKRKERKKWQPSVVHARQFVNRHDNCFGFRYKLVWHEAQDHFAIQILIEPLFLCLFASEWLKRGVSFQSLRKLSLFTDFDPHGISALVPFLSLYEIHCCWACLGARGPARPVVLLWCVLCVCIVIACTMSSILFETADPSGEAVVALYFL